VPSLTLRVEVAIGLVCLFGALAIVGAETGRQRLVNIGKPAATLSLLLIVGVPPSGSFGWLIVVGILCSLMGDVSLLGESDRAFIIGVAQFLVAHLCYAVAFMGVGGWNARLPAPAIAVIALSTVTLLLLWPTLGSMRIPVLIYTAVITVMVMGALATVNGSLPANAAAAAAIGAFLFYLSDTSLAWNRFRRPFRHAPVVVFTTYWLGQIGIALAGRWQAG
jgi:uncharacterized membrane protein YhhN